MTAPSQAHRPRVVVAAKSAAEHMAHLAAAIPELDVIAVPEEAGLDHIGDAEVLITIGRWLNPELVMAATRLKWVQCLITGTDHLTPVLRVRPDLVLTNARGIHGPQVAETTLFHMLSLARGGTQLAKMQAEHRSERITPMLLDGRTVTILGVGSIAETLGRYCKALGMTVLGVSRTPREIDGFDVIHPRERMRHAVTAADFVVVLLPATQETAGLVNADLLGVMKPTAFLINMSRGEIVDEAALLDALKTKRIAGAGLDVFKTFPLPADSLLWDASNIVITPWIGGQSDRNVADVAGIIRENMRSYLSGNIAGMINQVTTEAGNGD